MQQPVTKGPVSQSAAPAALPAAPAPVTVQDISALRIRRTELSAQLISAQGRRSSVANALRRSEPGPDRTGLEDRLGVLDRRMSQLESDIAETGRLLTSAPPALLTQAGSPGSGDGPSPGQITAMGIVGTLFIGAPLAIAFARLIWRRGSRRDNPPVAPAPELVNRLERMEQGIEVIAIEVERISEGQRFVTQLMSDPAKRIAESARIAGDPPN